MTTDSKEGREMDPGAARMLYEHMRESYEATARQAIESLRAVLGAAEKRLDSDRTSLGYQLVSQSARRAMDEAQVFHSAAFGLEALARVAGAIPGEPTP
jgi:hypothetical protein